MTIENVKYPPAVNLFVTLFWKVKICVALSLHFPGIFAMSYKLSLRAIFSSLPQQWHSVKKVWGLQAAYSATTLRVNSCRSPSICQQRACANPLGAEITLVGNYQMQHRCSTPSLQLANCPLHAETVITLSQTVHFTSTKSTTKSLNTRPCILWNYEQLNHVPHGQHTFFSANLLIRSFIYCKSTTNVHATTQQ